MATTPTTPRHVDVSEITELISCDVESISGLINGSTTIRDLAVRPEWRDVTCIDPMGVDDNSLPSALTGDCELFASDAPRIAYTETFDDPQVVFVKEVNGVVSSGTGSLDMAEEVSEARSAVCEGRLAFARFAWREACGEVGFIEVEHNRTGLNPKEGDPHVFWIRGSDHEYTEYANALLGHLGS
jgi:hypothetical protein